MSFEIQDTVVKTENNSSRSLVFRTNHETVLIVTLTPIPGMGNQVLKNNVDVLVQTGEQTTLMVYAASYSMNITPFNLLKDIAKLTHFRSGVFYDINKLHSSLLSIDHALGSELCDYWSLKPVRCILPNGLEEFVTSDGWTVTIHRKDLNTFTNDVDTMITAERAPMGEPGSTVRSHTETTVEHRLGFTGFAPYFDEMFNKLGLEK